MTKRIIAAVFAAAVAIGLAAAPAQAGQTSASDLQTRGGAGKVTVNGGWDWGGFS